MRRIERVLVTGATGMLGQNLIRNYLSSGIPVEAVVNPESKRTDTLPDHPLLKVTPCALSMLGTLSGEADAVFHFAWDGTYGDARTDEARQMKNVGYTEHAVRMAKRFGARVFIGAGSQAEYGSTDGVLREDTPLNPDTAYGRAKNAARTAGERIANASGIDFIWTRLLSVYGPYDQPYTLIMSAARAFLSGESIDFTPGEQIWDYLYAEDAAEAFKTLAERGRSGRTYVLSGGEEKRLKDYILELRDAIDPDIRVRFGARPYNAHQVMHLAGDVSALFADTGYRPSTGFPEGIRKTIDFIRRENA